MRNDEPEPKVSVVSRVEVLPTSVRLPEPSPPRAPLHPLNTSNGSDWVLYYTAEGYPYYYNSITGASVWAEVNEVVQQPAFNETHYYADQQYFSPQSSQRNGSHFQAPYTENYATQSVINSSDYVPNSHGQNQHRFDEYDDGETGSEDHSQDEDNDGGSDDEDDEEEIESEESSLDDEANANFDQFLGSVEGKAALEAERQRLEQVFQKKIAKEAEKRLKASYGYAAAAKGSGKKKKAAPPFRVPGTGQIFASFWAPIESWFGLKAGAANKASAHRKKSPKSVLDIEGGRVSRFDDGDDAEAVVRPAETTATGNNLVDRRRKKGKKSRAAAGAAAIPDRRTGGSEDDSGTSSADAESSSGVELSQNEDSSDEDEESVSSDDSDVKIIKAPLVPEWLTWESISSKWSSIVSSGPVQQLQTQSASALSAISPYFQSALRKSVSVAQVVGTTALVHTQWALQITGGHVATASTAAWGQVNERLQRYVEESAEAAANQQRILTNNVNIIDGARVVRRTSDEEEQGREGGREGGELQQDDVVITVSDAKCVSNYLSAAAATPLPETPRV